MNTIAAEMEQQTIGGQAQEIRPGRVVHVAVHPGTHHADTVVFLCHGSGGNKNQWRNQWQALAEAGYTLVAWDGVGHGASPKPRDPAQYRGGEFVRDYLAVFDRYRRGRNLLVGHSYGGVLTVHVLQHLQAAGRLADVRAAAVLGTPVPGAGQALPMLRLPLFVLNLIKPLLARKFRQLAWDPSAPPALIAHEERVASRNPMYVFRALMSQAEPFDMGRLAELRLPVAVVAGASDGLAPPANARLLADALPEAQWHVFDGCGHQIMLEKPQAVDRLLLDLLLDLPAP